MLEINNVEIEELLQQVPRKCIVGYQYYISGDGIGSNVYPAVFIRTSKKRYPNDFCDSVVLQHHQQVKICSIHYYGQMLDIM